MAMRVGRGYADSAPWPGGGADSIPSRRQLAERLSERLRKAGKAKTSDVEALRAELRAICRRPPARRRKKERRFRADSHQCHESVTACHGSVTGRNLKRRQCCKGLLR